MNRMLEQLGGRDVWANARSLFTMEKARHIDYGDGVVATFWRDLEHPAEKAEFKHSELRVVYAWDKLGGWISSDGEIRDFIDDEISERVSLWHRELFTLYHQMALGNRALKLEKLNPNGFRVFNEESEAIGEFRITPDGELYYWKRLHGNKSKTYLYGPHKSFGAIHFPDWNTSSDGEWGSYFVQVLPSKKPFADHVSIRKPITKWQGGAVRKDCTPTDQ